MSLASGKKMFVERQSGLAGPLFISTLKSGEFGSAGMLFGVSGNNFGKLTWFWLK